MPSKPKKLLCRWREDGGDWMTGSLTEKGTGGLVAWHVNPYHFSAHAWYCGERFDFKRQFKTEYAAQRAVERWLLK
jgi:hypothetical protein